MMYIKILSVHNFDVLSFYNLCKFCMDEYVGMLL